MLFDGMPRGHAKLSANRTSRLLSVHLEDLTGGRNQFAKKPVMLQFFLGREDVYIAKAAQVFENAVVFAVESETGMELFFRHSFTIFKVS